VNQVISVMGAQLGELGDDVAVVRVDAVDLDEGAAGVVVVAGGEVEIAEVVEQAEVGVFGQVGRREPALVPLDGQLGQPLSGQPRGEQQSSR
jgi:hypothetical protein